MLKFCWNSHIYCNLMVLVRTAHLSSVFNRRICPVKQVRLGLSTGLTCSSGPARLRCRWYERSRRRCRPPPWARPGCSADTPDPRTRHCYTPTPHTCSLDSCDWGRRRRTASRCGSSWWEWPSGTQGPTGLCSWLDKICKNRVLLMKM